MKTIAVISGDNIALSDRKSIVFPFKKGSIHFEAADKKTAAKMIELDLPGVNENIVHEGKRQFIINEDVPTHLHREEGIVIISSGRSHFWKKIDNDVFEFSVDPDEIDKFNLGNTGSTLKIFSEILRNGNFIFFKMNPRERILMVTTDITGYVGEMDHVFITSSAPGKTFLRGEQMVMNVANAMPFIPIFFHKTLAKGWRMINNRVTMGEYPDVFKGEENARKGILTFSHKTGSDKAEVTLSHVYSNN